MTSEELVIENKRLEMWIDDLQSGMYINCVYCGHRYGPMDEVTIPMRKQLEQHINSCPKHPLSKARDEIAKLKQQMEVRDARRV
jgi:hypothetical protein